MKNGGYALLNRRPHYYKDGKSVEYDSVSDVAEIYTMLAKNKGDLARIEPLAKINAVSQSDLDTSQANCEASLEAAEANLRAAKIQLSYTKIYSPIDGIIGKTQAKVGDFVGKNPSPVILSTVSQVDTILVTFFITDTQYLAFARAIAREDAAQAEKPSDNFSMILIDGSLYEHGGNLDFIDRDVDTTTGAIQAQASNLAKRSSTKACTRSRMVSRSKPLSPK